MKIHRIIASILVPLIFLSGGITPAWTQESRAPSKRVVEKIADAYQWSAGLKEFRVFPKHTIVELILTGKISAAEKIYRPLLALSPQQVSNPTAMIGLFSCAAYELEFKQQPAKADELLKRVEQIQTCAGSDRSDNLFIKLAIALHRDPTLQSKEFLALANSNPDEVGFQLCMLSDHDDDEHPYKKDTLLFLRRGIELCSQAGKSHSLFQVKLAEELISRKEYKEAESVLKTALSDQIRNKIGSGDYQLSEIVTELIKLLNLQGRTAEAAELTRQYLSKASTKLKVEEKEEEDPTTEEEFIRKIDQCKDQYKRGELLEELGLFLASEKRFLDGAKSIEKGVKLALAAIPDDGHDASRNRQKKVIAWLSTAARYYENCGNSSELKSLYRRQLELMTTYKVLDWEYAQAVKALASLEPDADRQEQVFDQYSAFYKLKNMSDLLSYRSFLNQELDFFNKDQQRVEANLWKAG